MKLFKPSHHLSWVFLISLAFVACKDDTAQLAADRKAEEQKRIETYLLEKGFTSTKTASGLHHIVVVEGTGTTSPNLSSDVEVRYKGSLLNGQIFDQSAENKTITFGLSEVILGWQEGLQRMKLNEKAILILPSHLGYGSRTLPGIPANSVLVFDIELKGFN